APSLAGATVPWGRAPGPARSASSPMVWTVYGVSHPTRWSVPVGGPSAKAMRAAMQVGASLDGSAWRRSPTRSTIVSTRSPYRRTCLRARSARVTPNSASITSPSSSRSSESTARSSRRSTSGTSSSSPTPRRSATRWRRWGSMNSYNPHRPRWGGNVFARSMAMSQGSRRGSTACSDEIVTADGNRHVGLCAGPRGVLRAVRVAQERCLRRTRRTRRRVRRQPLAYGEPSRLGGASAPPAARAAVASPPTTTGPLVRFADVQGPSLQLAPVQVGDGLLCLGWGAHLHEAEAPRASGRAIGDDRRRLAGSYLAEERLEVRARGREGKISDEQLLAHSTLLPPPGGRLDFVAVA